MVVLTASVAQDMIDTNKDGKCSLEEVVEFMRVRYYESDMMKGDEAKLNEQATVLSPAPSSTL